MKVKTMRAIHFLFVSVVFTVSACSNYPSAIDENFGASVRNISIKQTAHPNPPPSSDLPSLSDGQSAKSSVDRYQKTFDILPLPSNVFNIGVGSGTGGVNR